MKKNKERIFGIQVKIIGVIVTCVILTMSAVLGIVLPQIANTMTASVYERLSDLATSSSVNVLSAANEIVSTLKFGNQDNTMTEFIQNNAGMAPADDAQGDAAQEETINKATTKESKEETAEETSNEETTQGADESLDSSFSQLMTHNSSIQDIMILDSDGEVIDGTNDSYDGQDYSSWSFYTDIINGAESAQSGYFTDEDGQACFITAIALAEDDETTGILAAIVTVDSITTVLNNLSVEGVSSIYALVVDENDVVLSSTDTDLIGTTVTEEDIYQENSKDGLYFNFDGTKMFGAYSEFDTNSWTLIIGASQTEIMGSMYSLIYKSLFAGVGILVVMVIVGYFFGKNISGPIIQTKEELERISQLKFDQNEEYQQLLKRKDETGQMCQAIVNMTHQVDDALSLVKTTSRNINENAEVLVTMTGNVNENVAENSASNSELSACMEEVTSMTEHIVEQIGQFNEKAQGLGSQIEKGTQMAVQIKTRANGMKEEFDQSSRQSSALFNEVKKDMNQAMEQSKAIKKIEEFADAIRAIADQTKLLSLNASIEAARAGESGQGFAVVASEIGNLAMQSAQTVESMSVMVGDINQATIQMQECLNKTVRFMEENIMPNFTSMQQMSEKYQEDAIDIDSTMNYFKEGITAFELMMQTIESSSEEISKAMQESAIGVNDMADRNQEIVALTEQTNEVVLECSQYVKVLEENMSKFQLSQK